MLYGHSGEVRDHKHLTKGEIEDRILPRSVLVVDVFPPDQQ